MQIGHELPQRPGGKDVHHWSVTTGFDHLPPEWPAGSSPPASACDNPGETGRIIELRENPGGDRVTRQANAPDTTGDPLAVPAP